MEQSKTAQMFVMYLEQIWEQGMPLHVLKDNMCLGLEKHQWNKKNKGASLRKCQTCYADDPLLKY